MKEKTEKCATEIEALLKEHDLFIDGGELRDILSEEFEKADTLSGGERTGERAERQDSPPTQKQLVRCPCGKSWIALEAIDKLIGQRVSDMESTIESLRRQVDDLEHRLTDCGHGGMM